MLQSDRVHPETLFLQMLTLAGALTTFSPKLEPRDLPQYEHEELGPCFIALDAMIAVGGLTRYAAGDDSVIVRTIGGKQYTYAVHLDSLIKDGDVSSNVAMQPGDILIIPQRLF